MYVAVKWAMAFEVLDHPRVAVSFMLLIPLISFFTTGFILRNHHYQSVPMAMVCVGIYGLMLIISVGYFVYIVLRR